MEPIIFRGTIVNQPCAMQLAKISIDREHKNHVVRNHAVQIGHFPIPSIHKPEEIRSSVQELVYIDMQLGIDLPVEDISVTVPSLLLVRL